jgi:hypothetical protein
VTGTYTWQYSNNGYVIYEVSSKAIKGFKCCTKGFNYFLGKEAFKIN